MSRFGDGLAVGPDLVHGAKAAAEQALETLSGATPDLAFVFVCHDDPEVVADAGQVAGEVTGAGTVLGCSASGVIGAGRGVELTSAISVWVASLPDARLRSFHLEVMSTTDGLAVVGLPEPQDDDGVVVLLADPYSFPADGFVERSNDAMPGLPIVGGLAAGLRGVGSTRLFLDGRVVDRGAVGVVVGGGVAALPVVSQGCRPVGPDMVVTSADGNVVLELAGVPALRKLEEIVATLPAEEQALVTGGLQLGIAMNEYAEVHQQGDFLVRGIVGADQERNGLVVGDIVPTGRTVRFQVRDPEAADADLRELLARFRVDAPFSEVDGALLFSCNGRGRTLFTTADHDVDVVRRMLATPRVAGFFASGEIGPVAGRNHVHGFTAAILAFGSDGGSRERPGG